MSHDVFISHSVKDKPTADAACAMLESNGVRCWIAPRDVTPGMEWGECIIDAIEECRIMVLVFTTHANDSPQIRREVERAVNHGVAILPVRIEDVLPGRALEYFIGNVHWLDALTPPLESHLRNLADTVKILLARIPQRIKLGDATPGTEAPIPAPGPPPITKMAEPARPPAAEPRAQERPSEAPPKQPAFDPPWPLQATHRESVPPQKSVAPPAFNPLPPPPPPKGVYQGLVRQGVMSRPVEITIIAIVNFAMAALLIFLNLQTIGRSSMNMNGFMALFIDGVAIAAGVGLIGLKNWGRILQLILTGVSLVTLLNPISYSQYHSRPILPYLHGVWFVRPLADSLWPAIILWMAYYGWVAWYLFTPGAKQVFGELGTGQSAFPSGFAAVGAQRRPVGVTVVARVGFAIAAFLVFGFVHDSLHSLNAGEISVPVLACAIAAASYGQLKLKTWGRILEIIVFAVGIVVLLFFVSDAFSEFNFGTFMWVLSFVYCGGVIWYMFTPDVKQVFKGPG